MTERMRRRLGRLVAGAALVLLLALLVGGYGTYRVTAFARDTFRPDTVPTRGALPDPRMLPRHRSPACAPVGRSPSCCRAMAGRATTEPT